MALTTASLCVRIFYTAVAIGGASLVASLFTGRWSPAERFFQAVMGVAAVVAVGAFVGIVWTF